MKRRIPILAAVATIAVMAGAIAAWDQIQAKARRERRARRRTLD